MAPVYDKNLSHDEVKALIKFYTSPEGKRVIAAMPKIQRESMVIGQQWGEKIAQRVAQKLSSQQGQQ